jgi:hypothetical protein
MTEPQHVNNLLSTHFAQFADLARVNGCHKRRSFLFRIRVTGISAPLTVPEFPAPSSLWLPGRSDGCGESLMTERTLHKPSRFRYT